MPTTVVGGVSCEPVTSCSKVPGCKADSIQLRIQPYGEELVQDVCEGTWTTRALEGLTTKLPETKPHFFDSECLCVGFKHERAP